MGERWANSGHTAFPTLYSLQQGESVGTRRGAFFNGLVRLKLSTKATGRWKTPRISRQRGGLAARLGRIATRCRRTTTLPRRRPLAASWARGLPTRPEADSPTWQRRTCTIIDTVKSVPHWSTWRRHANLLTCRPFMQDSPKPAI